MLAAFLRIMEAREGCELVYCNDLKVNDYIIINDKPCQINQISHHPSGKFGYQKRSISATILESGQHIDQIFVCHAQVEVPKVTLKEYSVNKKMVFYIVAKSHIVRLSDVEQWFILALCRKSLPIPGPSGG